MLKVIEDKEEIKLLFKLFLKEHIVMFQSNHKQQEINTILFNILEEFSLIDVFTIEDILMINKIALEKYKKLFEFTKNSTKKFLSENNNSNEESNNNNYLEENSGNFYAKNEEKLILSDINECKSSILSMINTYFIYFSKNFSIAENLFKVNLFLIFFRKL